MNRDGRRSEERTRSGERRRSEERTRSGERRPAGERRSGSGREPDGSGAPGDGEGRPGHSPPIRAVAILGRLIPWLEREAVLADLAELYRIKVERHGPVAARRWYWRQVAAFAFRRPFRGADGSGWGAVFGDLKYAARTLLRSPTFTITAIVTLALGIGANTAVFSVVNSVLLREIPYPDADRLLWVYTDAPPNRWPFSVADLQFLEERNRTFESVAGWSPRRMTFAASGVAERILANRVTASFFGTLGVAPALGRDFTPADAAPGAEPTVIVSQGFWSTRLGGDPDVLGRTVRLDGTNFTVVGVMPAEVGPLEGPQSELWPLMQPTPPERKGPFFLRIVGRMRTGVTHSATSEELRLLNDEMFPLWADTYSDQTASWSAITAMESVVGDVRTPLVALLVGAAIVLLIAATNVANLVLARATTRSQEMSVRAALGASRFRLTSIRLAETAFVAVAGGALGVGLAVLGISYLTGLGPQALPRLEEVGVDGVALAFATLVTLGSAVVVGMLPGVGGSGSVLASEIRSGSRSVVGGGFRRLRSSLVALQFAFAIPLLIGAGLLVNSFAQLRAVDPGFDASRVMAFHLALPPDRYPDSATREELWARLTEGLEAIPGVDRAGLNASRIPDFVSEVNNFSLETYRTPAGEQDPASPWMSATAGYFRALGVPLIAGRHVDERSNAPPELVVDQRWVTQHLPPDVDAIGQRLVDGPCTAQVEPVFPCRWWTIVGVVGHVKYRGLDQDDGAIYSSLSWGYEELVRVHRHVGGPGGLGAPSPARGDRPRPGAAGCGARYRRRSAHRFGCPAAVSDDAARRVRDRGADPGSRRHLRGDVLLREPTDARHRGPDRAWWPADLGRADGRRTGPAPGGRRDCRRHRRLVRRHPLHRKHAVRREPAGSAHLRGHHRGIGAVTVAACFLPARRAARVDPVVALRED